MPTIKNLELRDNIRNDALIIMKNNPDLSYEDAYEQAKENLIGNQSIIDFEFKPLTTVNNMNITEEQSIQTTTDNPYLDDIKNRLKNDIDVEKFSEEQLEEYNISKEMGIEISSFADPGYNPEQIKYLSTQILVGKPINQYIGNYTFDPDREIISNSLD